MSVVLEAGRILDARTQLRMLLDEHPDAVDVLRERLLGGLVDGWVYWYNGCGCVLGTVAFAEGAKHPSVVAAAMGWPTEGCRPFKQLEWWADPIERHEEPDHTAPEDSGPFRAALLVSWVDEWKAERA